MKFNFTKSLLLAALSCIAFTQSTAIPYTATSSGNFSSSSTWLGGQIPPTTINANDIVINNGVTVTLDRNLNFNNSNSVLQLNGNASIVSTGNYRIEFNNGFLTGTNPACKIDIDSIHFGGLLLPSINYAGQMTARGMSISGANIAFNITIKETLRLFGTASNLSTGKIDFATGGSSNPVIVFDGGSLNNGGGIVDLTNPYNVKYTDPSASVGGGWELGGTGLEDVEFDLGGSGNLALAGGLNISGGKLILTSGTVTLGSNTLTISGTGSIDGSGTGTISSTSSSDITISSSASPLGELRMHFSDHTVNNFTMNAGTSTAELKIGSDLIIATQLDLQGGRLNIQGNTLTLSSSGGATINGGSASSFIITESGGKMLQSIGSGASKLFPVGHSGGYAGVTIGSMNNTSYTDFGVNVAGEVNAHVSSGTNLATSEPLVNATWTTTHTPSTGLDYSIEPVWETALEVNSFDRSKCYVTHHISNDWDKSTSGAATGGSGLHARKRDNVQTLGSFAVFDENTTGIQDITGNNIANIYPNPAQNFLNIELSQKAGVSATIYNTSGQAVTNSTIKNGTNSLYIGDLPAGVYFLQLTGEHSNATTRFVKQ